METPGTEHIPLVLEWYVNEAKGLVEDFEIRYIPRKKMFRASFKNNTVGYGNITESAMDIVCPTDDSTPLAIGPKEFLITGEVQ